jgi:TonB family protein
MQQPMIFDVSGGVSRDFATVEKASKKNQEKIPALFRYDIAPKPKGVLIPVYPYALAKEKINGNATVAFIVDEEGSVAETKVVEASKPEFGLAMVAAVEAFSFIPAMKDGKPTKAFLRMEHKFAQSGLEPTMTSEDWHLLSLEKKHPEEILSAKKLDAPLKPVSQRSPVFPASLQGGGIDRGEALIEILIDEEGKVRLPRIARATEPAFGYAAIQAVVDWRFEPPKAGGKSAVVHVQVPFGFKQQSQSAKPAVLVPVVDQATLDSALPQEKQP